jgi:hypothetical protein
MTAGDLALAQQRVAQKRIDRRCAIAHLGRSERAGDGDLGGHGP